MIDTLLAFNNQIEEDRILDELGVKEKTFALMTMHRPSNVDSKEHLEILIKIINKVSETDFIIFPIHPRTKKSMIKHDVLSYLTNNKRVVLTEALSYFSFQKLINSCKYVLTDSGGIQEETTFRKIPCLTLRNNTERPSTIIVGSNELVEYNFEAVMSKINEINNGSYKRGNIPFLWDGKATERIVAILRDKL
jgi:UDP-N-acetylglucosamine 2-epimerase (non-hydrolysing)